jgi:hypothetical protein
MPNPLFKKPKEKESNSSNGSRVAISDIYQPSTLWITSAWLPGVYLDYLSVKEQYLVILCSLQLGNTNDM